MFESTNVAVVVPAHNEALLIRRVLRGLPDWIRFVVVVDDASTDDTAAVVDRCAQNDPRVRLVRHAVNQGVGAAITTGYRHAIELQADVVVVMAGDDQMDPSDLPALVEPVARGAADYAKGDRLHHPQAAAMPLIRRVGTGVLGWLTGLAIGMPDLHDSQCGYTAISASALRHINLDDVWSGYGYPNDLLAHLAAAHLRIVDVVVRPVYADETSELRARHLLRIAWLIARGAWLVRRPAAQPSRYAIG